MAVSTTHLRDGLAEGAYILPVIGASTFNKDLDLVSQQLDRPS